MKTVVPGGNSKRSVLVDLNHGSSDKRRKTRRSLASQSTRFEHIARFPQVVPRKRGGRKVTMKPMRCPCPCADDGFDRGTRDGPPSSRPGLKLSWTYDFRESNTVDLLTPNLPNCAPRRHHSAGRASTNTAGPWGF